MSMLWHEAGNKHGLTALKACLVAIPLTILNTVRLFDMIFSFYISGQLLPDLGTEFIFGLFFSLFVIFLINSYLILGPSLLVGVVASLAVLCAGRKTCYLEGL